MSFTIGDGETVALVGRSGAGKSTCAHLLMRFWDVDTGTITVGGRDIRSLPQEQLRDLITLVPQDVYLFNISLGENIRLGFPDASDHAVEAAAKSAFAHEFISALPKGYDTVVGELGGRLSGGQRQRIAIARAVLKDSPVLIMDEAVSSLDATSEREVAAAMANARHGRTTIIIAHRLSTILGADRVVVLADGSISQIGEHATLINANGTYKDLMGSQIESDQAAPEEV